MRRSASFGSVPFTKRLVRQRSTAEITFVFSTKVLVELKQLRMTLQFVTAVDILGPLDGNWEPPTGRCYCCEVKTASHFQGQ